MSHPAALPYHRLTLPTVLRCALPTNHGRHMSGRCPTVVCVFGVASSASWAQGKVRETGQGRAASGRRRPHTTSLAIAHIFLLLHLLACILHRASCISHARCSVSRYLGDNPTSDSPSPPLSVPSYRRLCFAGGSHDDRNVQHSTTGCPIDVYCARIPRSHLLLPHSTAARDGRIEYDARMMRSCISLNTDVFRFPAIANQAQTTDLPASCVDFRSATWGTGGKKENCMAAGVD
jgi:hypothetical protein